VGKFFDAVYNIFAWVWNHVWGTLFFIGGGYALLHTDEIPFYYALLCIGIGIYFFWSRSWTKAAENVADKLADSITARSDGAQAAPAASFCEQCGSKLEVDAAFCAACGTRIA